MDAIHEIGLIVLILVDILVLGLIVDQKQTSVEPVQVRSRPERNR